jgi:hypothetical protein
MFQKEQLSRMCKLLRERTVNPIDTYLHASGATARDHAVLGTTENASKPPDCTGAIHARGGKCRGTQHSSSTRRDA